MVESAAAMHQVWCYACPAQSFLSSCIESLPWLGALLHCQPIPAVQSLQMPLHLMHAIVQTCKCLQMMRMQCVFHSARRTVLEFEDQSVPQQTDVATSQHVIASIASM